MRRILTLLLLCSSIIVLPSCASNSSLSLAKATVQIVQDGRTSGSIGIPLGNGKFEYVKPTDLYYKFTIKNTGDWNVGSMYHDRGLEVKIDPSAELVSASKDVVGFNIFDSSDYVSSGMGYGYSGTPIIDAHKNGEYVLTFDLGVSKAIQGFHLTPPADKLRKLEDEALNADLVVTENNKEIARFDLKKKNK